MVTEIESVGDIIAYIDERQAKREKRRRRRLKNMEFSALVVNVMTKEMFYMQTDPDIFSRLRNDHPVEVFECTSAKHLPADGFTKFKYKRRVFLKAVLEIVRAEPVINEYWWHAKVN